MKNKAFWWPVIIILSAMTMLLILIFNIGLPIRPLMAFWVLLICPGMAFVWLLSINDALTELILAIGLSIVIDTIVAQIMLYNHWWSIELGLIVIIDIAAFGVVLQVIRVSRATFDQSLK